MLTAHLGQLAPITGCLTDLKAGKSKLELLELLNVNVSVVNDILTPAAKPLAVGFDIYGTLPKRSSVFCRRPKL